MEANFTQKKVNHIFHYTKNFDSLVSILSTGFSPSYCEEQIADLTYLIPMVSFCNIPIRDVDLYMRYGNCGIGMSIEWAIKNRISPVIYVHENSPFNDLHRRINEELLLDMVYRQFEDIGAQIETAVDRGEVDYHPKPKEGHSRLLPIINRITVPTLQFFKNWKVQYQQQEIITYQEREWRYVPDLQDGKRIIESSNDEFDNYKNGAKPKPHLPEYLLPIDTISDLRYIIISNEDERRDIINCLTEKFGDKDIINALYSGTLLIFTDEQVKNDF